MKKELSEYLAYISTERGFSGATVKAYSYDLSKFGAFIEDELGQGWEWQDLDQYTIKAFLQFLANSGYRNSNSSVSRGRKLAVIKSFLKYLAESGKIKNNPAQNIKMPKVNHKEPSYLTEQEYKRLLRIVKKNATKYFKYRDTAIITLLVGLGLRLKELVSLDIGDINFDDGTIKVKRKGNGERILPAGDQILIEIKRYLRTRNETDSTQPLFISKRNQRISNASVWYLVKKYLKQARIEKDKLSPHTLRHTFATTLLKQGENLLTIKELLSHRNIRTTERYLHISNKDLKMAVGKIDLTGN